MVGKSLAHYQILEKLGAGGMGVVYKARDTHLDRFAALKVLPPEKVSDPDRKRRFIQEAKAASALNHPSIITIYDIDQANGTDFIAMEYVPGKTLDELIPRKGMRLSLALKYAVQIADALARAHGAGIIHRDLKPSNVMVDEHGLVKVLDFGLAKLTEAAGPEAETATTETAAGAIVGTAAYMSPEQAEGKHIDTRSDIFSFGSMLYEMLTGQRAFHGGTTASTIASILREEPKPISQIAEALPRDAQKIVRRCLRKDPEHRFQTMADLRVTLDELIEESDPGALEAAAPGVTARGRLWWVGVLAGASVMTAALGISGWFWLIRSRPTPAESPMNAVPLTSYRGSEGDPSLSPDGTQVAFYWSPEDPGQKSHIYVKQLGVEPPVQLTNAAANDFSPSWSPDGLSIAFVRELERTRRALILIPQRGGRERQLVTWNISNAAQPLSEPYLAWTPDSRWLAFPCLQGEQRTYALSLIAVDTGERRPLTTVPAGSEATLGGDTSPAFSPDGRTLAFIRDMVDRQDLYLLRLAEDYRPEGEPERVNTGNPANLSPCWTPDGRDIVLSSGTFWNSGLWRVRVLEPTNPVRLGFTPDNARSPSISGSGSRLACMIGRTDADIWHVGLQDPGRRPVRPDRLISSTRFDANPACSPDGKRIAFISLRSGAHEVWICDSDGSNPAQLTSFGGAFLWGPSWSPDGQNVGFWGNQEGNNDVYVVSVGGETPRRMTTHRANEEFPVWSKDGRWLYFNSDRTGHHEIWRMPSQGGEEIQITRTSGSASASQISADGKFLYYQRGWPVSGSVWRIPVGGGEETIVIESVTPGGPSWKVARDGIYYLSVPDDRGLQDLHFYDLATGITTKILENLSNYWGGIAVSPDGRTILYTQLDDMGSDLMLVENFR